MDAVALVEPDLAGVWSAIYAARNAVLWLAVSDPDRGNTRCTDAAVALGDALSELEWARPGVTAGAVVDLGPLRPGDDFDTCLAHTTTMLRAAVHLAATMLTDRTEPLTVGELVAVAHAVHRVSDAHVRLIGHLL